MKEIDDNSLWTGREVKRLLAKDAEAGPEIVSTVQAARILGYSPKWWARKCGAGEVDGAYQDEGYWRLPLSSGRALILKRQHSCRRGPSKKAPPAFTASARAKGVSGRKVLSMRPEAVGRRPDRSTKPERPRLA